MFGHEELSIKGHSSEEDGFLARLSTEETVASLCPVLSRSQTKT
jgi:hypothetical protein